MTSKVVRNWFEKPVWHKSRSVALHQLLLNGWLKTQKRFASLLHYRDFAHRYSERPHVGFVAAGVWCAGGSALEEWKTEKQKNTDDSYGRCDLWFSMRNGRGHNLEAKYCWLTLQGDEEKIADRLSERMKDALRAARKLRTGPEPRLAMLSVGILSPKKECPGEPASLLRNVFRLLKSECCDAAAASILKKKKIEKGEAFGTVLLLLRSLL